MAGLNDILRKYGSHRSPSVTSPQVSGSGVTNASEATAYLRERRARLAARRAGVPAASSSGGSSASSTMGGSSSSGSAGSGSSSGSGSIDAAGYPTLDFKVPEVTKDQLAQTYGIEGFTEPWTAGQDAAIDEDISRLRDFGRGLLSGKLPADVSEAVRRATAAGASARGILPSSQMGRNLTARDLGMTTLDLQGKGAEVVGKASEMAQSRLQFRKQYQLAEGEFQNLIRTSNMNEAQLAQAKHEFRNRTVLALNEQMIGLSTFREDLQFRYAATDLQGDAGKASGPLSTIDNLLAQLLDTLDL